MSLVDLDRVDTLNSSSARLNPVIQRLGAHTRQPWNNSRLQLQGVSGRNRFHQMRMSHVFYANSRYKSGGPFWLWVFLDTVLVQGFHEPKSGEKVDDCYP